MTFNSDIKLHNQMASVFYLVLLKPYTQRSHHSKQTTVSTNEIRFPKEAGTFLLSTTPRPALGPTQPPIQWLPSGLSVGIKRTGREAGHSLPSRAEVKNVWGLVFPNTPSWHGA
jgi:hypothetical protein